MFSQIDFDFFASADIFAFVILDFRTYLVLKWLLTINQWSCQILAKAALRNKETAKRVISDTNTIILF